MRKFILWGIAGLAALLLPACKVTETEYIDSYYPVYQVDASTIGIPLASAEDLAKIGVDPGYPLGGAYVLAADIDLSAHGAWEPIGTFTAPFSGIFDGNGQTIRGLKLSGGARDYTGLFGCLLNARLSNLTIEADTVAVLVSSKTDNTNPNSTATAVGAGVAAGFINSSYINNITIRGTVSLARAGTTNEFDAGALAGVIRSSDVSRIIVDMNLVAAGPILYAGLIAGRTVAGTTAYCQAEGRLDASASGALYVGGIIGSYTGPTENCASAASVYAAGFGEMNVGGIAGQTPAGIPSVTSCSLRSDHPVTIQGKSQSTATSASTVYVGGIVGHGGAAQCLVDADVEIIAEAVNLPALYAGGIAGQVLSNGSVINSYVRRGAVRAKAPNVGTVATTYVFAGGIAGRLYAASASASCLIENCFSGADVTAECAVSITNMSSFIGVGGVAGGNYNAVSVTKSGSSGSVSAVFSNSAQAVPVLAGGIMGRHSIGTNTALTMRQCAALNPQITAESAGTAASAKASAYRVLGGATTGSGSGLTVLTPEAMLANAYLTLGLNYGIQTTEIKTKSGAGGWETVPIPTENNSASYMGGNIPNVSSTQPLTQAFFENVLGWDFGATWGWDAAANLPYPLTN
jgi:hypothetical protein